jgi:hypothetical protein
MIAIALIVGVVIVLLLVQRALGKTINLADRAIRRKTYVSGRQEAGTALVISAPVIPSVLIAKIIEVVNAYESAPVVVAGLYLKDHTQSAAAFAFGNKTGGDHFVAQVKLRPTDQGSAGRFEVLRWRESGAEIYGRKEMVRLRERITDAATNLGGTATSTCA